MSELGNTRNQPCPVDPHQLGRVDVTPGGPFPVMARGSWTVRYTVGRFGIDDGGAVLLSTRPADDGFAPQFDRPGEPGYTAVTTDGDAVLEARFQTDFWVRPYRRAIVVTVRDGSLAEGDTVSMALGGDAGRWRLQSFPERHHLFAVAVDAFGTGEFYWLPEQPQIDIVPAEPAAIELVVPSTPGPGEDVTAHVRLTDACGNPVDEAEGEATVECDRSVEGLPAAVPLAGGVTPVGPLRFGEPGVYRLECRWRDLAGRSNPVCVGDHARARLFWADMHGQTRETVGVGTPEEYFSFARDKALVDVSAHQGNDFQITDAFWGELRETVARFNEPGRFVALLGYEWSGLTPAGGDHNVYFLGDDADIHRSGHWQIHDGGSTASDRYPIAELWREFAGRDDVLVAGHVGGRYCNLALASDEFPHLVEIHSHHGTFEWVAEEAFRGGLTVGLVAQSDDHTCRPGLSGPLYAVDPQFVSFDVPGGYTGVYADELTREAVWRALKSRHTFATTGRRMILGVCTRDGMMGDVVTRRPGEPLELDIRANAHGAPILDLEVRRDDLVVHRHPWPEDTRAEWIRVEWSGVRVRSRRKVARWDGRMTIDGGRFAEVRPYAFDQPGQGVERTDERTLAVRSTTSGDVDGVLLRIDGDAATLSVELGGAAVATPVAGLSPEPLRVDAGGVNRELRLSRVEPAARTEQIELTWTEPDPPLSGRHAYWVKVLQADGATAWSSPVFVDRRAPEA